MNIFTNKKYNVTEFGDRAMSLINQNAIIKTNKLESVPFKITNESILRVLENSEFETIREKLGDILSKRGEAIVLVLPFKNTFVVDVLEVVNYEKIGKFNTMLEGMSGATATHNNLVFDIVTKLHFVDGKPTLSRYFEYVNGDESEIIEYGEDYTFNTNELPGELFKNNFKGQSDIVFVGVVEDLQRLSYHDRKLTSEWERTRTTPIYNLNFTDNDPDLYTSLIDNGQGFIGEDGFGAKLGAGMNMMPATAGTQVLQAQIIFLEDDIKNKLGMRRDTVNSGSNQHNLEVIMANEEGTETLLRQRKIRELNWNSFFEKLASVLGTTADKVDVVLSEIENSKIKLLEATVLEAQVKAQNITSQVENGGANKENEEQKTKKVEE